MPNETGTAVATIQAGANMLMDGHAFEHGQRVATLFASSQLVPPHLRGKDKIADCFIALHMAQRLNEDPLIVMQNIYIVSGRAGWSAQYMIGRANRSGVFKGRINWRVEGKGEALSVTAFAKLAEDGEEVTATASMAMAKAEGWTKNAKYQSMPELMLRYRSATMLIRLYAPEVMLGIPTAEENEDVAAAGQMRDITPPGAGAMAQMTGAMDAFEAAAAGTQVITDVETDGATQHDDDTGEVIDQPADAAPPDEWAEELSRLETAARACSTLTALSDYLADEAKHIKALPPAHRERWDAMVGEMKADLRRGA